jgi:hypothetical protein
VTGEVIGTTTLTGEEPCRNRSSRALLSVCSMTTRLANCSSRPFQVAGMLSQVSSGENEGRPKTTEIGLLLLRWEPLFTLQSRYLVDMLAVPWHRPLSPNYRP